MSNQPVEGHAEAAVVARARSGDEAAFAELMRGHQDMVYGLALRLTADTALAADVAQEAFIRAWRALPRFRGDAAFSTWMHRITVNTAWTLRRRAKRHEASEVPDQLAAPGPIPEEAGEHAELRARLGRAIAQLPPAARILVVLKDVYGWSHAEAADHLGISETAAKVRLHRGRRRLRQLLSDEGST